MGADFTWTPTWVTPRPPVFAVWITDSESFKKDYQLLDTNALRFFDLDFDGVSDSTRNSIIAHFNSVTGPYDSFVWTTVPSYLNSGTTMTVRHVENSYKEIPRERHWEITFSFEKVVL